MSTLFYKLALLCAHAFLVLEFFKPSGFLIRRYFKLTISIKYLSSLKLISFSVPECLTRCTRFVEEHGTVDGIYRISGIASNIKKLRNLFETQMVPQALHKEDWIIQDIHCVPSLIKLFFRELPEPLCPEKMYQLLRKGKFQLYALK